MKLLSMEATMPPGAASVAATAQPLSEPAFAASMEQAVVVLALCLAWAGMHVLKWAGKTL